MGNDDLPFLPWYPSEFHRSTATWPFSARSVYRELLDLQWLSHELPADPEELRELVRCPESEWGKAWRYCEPKFPVGGDGLRRNPRLEQHREKSISLRETNREKGKKGAAGRWGKDASSNASSNASSKAQAMPKHMPGQWPSSQSSSQSLSQSESSSETERTRGAGAPSRSRSRLLDDERLTKLKAVYPPYSGRKDWRKAGKAARQLIDTTKATFEQIEQGTSHYATFVARTGRQVMRPENFFADDGDPPCLQDWRSVR